MSIHPSPLPLATPCPAESNTRGGGILHHPLSRLILLPLALAPVAGVNAGISILVLDRLPIALARHQIIFQGIILVSLLMMAYRLFVLRVEKRSPIELSPKGAVRDFLLGSGLSSVWVYLFVALLTATGGYRIQAMNSPTTLLDGFFFFGMGAFAQELFFSLIVLRLMEEWCGTRIALPVALAAFLAAHAFNPNASLMGNLGLAALGTMFMGAFLWRRSLWMAWGLHFAWNFLQAGLFGMPNSGHTFKGLIQPTISGPTWLTGGAFGFEASLLTLVFSLSMAFFLLKKAASSGQFR